MEAASHGLHCTGADDGLEKARSGESGKSPPWCLGGTRALPRKNPFPRASPGNSPERWSQEDGREHDHSAGHVEINVEIIPAGAR